MSEMTYRQMADTVQQAATRLDGRPGVKGISSELRGVAGRLRTLHRAFGFPSLIEEDEMARAHREDYEHMDERRKLRDSTVAFMGTPACDDKLREIAASLVEALEARNARTVSRWN